MDRLTGALRSLQSNSESVTNGICGILALASVRLYGAFHFSCPCLPGYNTAYAAAVLLLPCIALFICGLMVNRRWLLLLREWRRPEGGRPRDISALLSLLLGVVRSAALPPAAWLIVALLDGKCLACALATSLEPGRFANVSGYTEAELRAALARLPCKDLASGPLPGYPPFSRKAAYRYLRTVSQAVGWTTLFLLILAAFLARSLKPCSRQVNPLRNWYWGNYLDLEEKIFEEMCCEHAHSFARRCVREFFVGPGEEGAEGQASPKGAEGEADCPLHGITNKEQLNQLLQRWDNAKPPLAIEDDDRQTPGHPGLSHGPSENGARHTRV
ncbi:calcium homeostasis modulator protein 3-like [Hemitrygon akajei]|uniref:calcium homeostasis modulator protein 3-like n=1 Tax=Hemitrygon akajei TaxID=2704970 RepID=UPI003BF9F641